MGVGGPHWRDPSITDTVFSSWSQRLHGRILPYPRWDIRVEFDSISLNELGFLRQTEMGSNSRWAISYTRTSKLLGEPGWLSGLNACLWFQGPGIKFHIRLPALPAGCLLLPLPRPHPLACALINK